MAGVSHPGDSNAQVSVLQSEILRPEVDEARGWMDDLICRPV